jgi:mannose-6-phosphate isomerase
MLYPFLFEANLFPRVWGGNRLKKIKEMSEINEPIGESWEVSVLARRESIVANGSLKGCNLRELVDQYGASLLGEAVYKKYGKEFPLLVKFIDAETDLSIQVHPNDELARERHACMGKTEMWYIVDAMPGAYLYAGFSKEISTEEYCQRIDDGSICDVLNKYEVKKGDVLYIPSGRVHSICAGIFLVEVQQSCDVTYRLFDYGRKDMNGELRELHTDLAIDALSLSPTHNCFIPYDNNQNDVDLLCKCDYFTVRHLHFDSPQTYRVKGGDSFVIYVCINGECMVGDSILLEHGRSCLVPASCKDINITVGDGEVELLEVFVSI